MGITAWQASHPEHWDRAESCTREGRKGTESPGNRRRMAAKKCAFGFVGMLSLIGLAFCFQWIAVTQDYFHALRNFGLFQQNADLKGGAVIWEATVSVGPRKGEAGDRSSDLRTAGTENFTYHLAEITNKSSLEVRNSLSECPENPPKLVGPLNIDLSVAITTDNVIDEYKDIEDGGRFRPADCSARQRIAIILPYRNRETHLTFWLHYLHSFLQRQQGDYGVYVIEQFGDATFNRAKLMNVGFNEAQNDLPYDTLFGGVVAFSKDQFLKINGYSNVFWGWGGEDDELYQRVVAAGMRVERPDKAIARSKMIVHHRDPGNESNGKSFPLIDQAARRMHADGLSTLQYKVLNRTKHKLYNKISVDIGHP